jgi:hypothetical protein
VNALSGVRLVGIDIDGTLLNSAGHITPATHRELQRLHEGGVRLVLVTGRRYESALSVARPLFVPVLLGLHNGASFGRREGATQN